jgi:hypothetical protein
MQNEQIDGLATNHSLALLLKQERMWVLDVEEMESSSKINLRNVLLWISIKDACRPRLPIIARLSKEGCISLVVKGKLFCVARKHDLSMCGPFST